MRDDQHLITEALHAVKEGERGATDSLWNMVYQHLGEMAHRQMLNERRYHTLTTHDLVNETYMRLVDESALTYEDRAHFFGIAARIMRNVLVDYARRRNAQKRGGGRSRVDLEDMPTSSEDKLNIMLLVDEALEALGKDYPRLRSVVEYRYFAGLTDQEIAACMNVSERTVQRDWHKAKGWLLRWLRTTQ